MIFLVIVPVCHLAQIFFNLIRIVVPTTAIGYIDNIDSGSWSGAFISLFSDTVVAVLHLFFFGLLNSLLSALGGCWPSFLVSRHRLLSPKIFHGGFLIANLIALCRLFVIDDALVHLPKHRKGQETSLSLDIDSFLYQLFLIVQLLAVLLHLSFNRKPKAFTEKTYQERLIRGSAIVKLKQDGLEILEVDRPILYLFQLVL